MDNRLTVIEFLRVFDSILSNGDRQDNKYHLGEMYAWHDYDGTTCWLGYKDVKVTPKLHGTLKIEYGKSSSYSDFIRLCLRLIVCKPAPLH